MSHCNKLHAVLLPPKIKYHDRHCQWGYIGWISCPKWSIVLGSELGQALRRWPTELIHAIKTQIILYPCLQHPPPVVHRGQCHMFCLSLSVNSRPIWPQLHTADRLHISIRVCDSDLRLYVWMDEAERGHRYICSRSGVVIGAEQPSTLV